MSTPAPASTTAPATRSRAGALLLSLLVLAALAAGGWYGWRAWQGRQAQQQAIAQQQQAALDARLDALKQGQRAQSQRLQQTEATNRLLRDEVLGIGQRAALIEDSVSRLADPDRQGDQALRLDQIELILAIGQQRLQLDGDMDGVRRALALAGPLLCALPSRELNSVNINSLTAEQAPLLTGLGLGADEARRAINARPAAGWGSASDFISSSGNNSEGSDSADRLTTATRWMRLSIVATTPRARVARELLIDTLEQPAAVVSSRWRAVEEAS